MSYIADQMKTSVPRNQETMAPWRNLKRKKTKMRRETRRFGYELKFRIGRQCHGKREGKKQLKFITLLRCKDSRYGRQNLTSEVVDQRRIFLTKPDLCFKTYDWQVRLSTCKFPMWQLLKVFVLCGSFASVTGVKTVFHFTAAVLVFCKSLCRFRF